MPAYSFKCNDCDSEFVAEYPIANRPDELTCFCGGSARRVIRWNGTSVLRGQGWARHPERDTANHKKGPQ